MTSGSTSAARWWERRLAHSHTNSSAASSRALIATRRTRPMAHVLFVCLHNAGRSQISQALFERAADGHHTATSAGTTPGDRVHPEVVEVMRELGIDLADRRPKLLSRELAEQADVVVTMGCGEECPFI